MKLFNIIKITIGSKVEPKLRQEMAEFVGKMPSMLNELEVRAKVAAAWKKLQAPIQVSDVPATFVTFKPTKVGFSGINIDNNILNAQVLLSGIVRVVSGGRPEVQVVELLPLEKVEPTGGNFAFNVPISVDFEELQSKIDQEYVDGYAVDALDGRFEIKKVRITGDSDGALRVEVDLDYDNRSKFVRFVDYFDWLDASGAIKFEAKPALDSDNNIISVTDLKVESETDNTILDAVVGVSQLPLIREFVQRAVKYNYSADLIEAMKKANDAMNVDLGDGVIVAGSLTSVGASNLKVDESKFTLTAIASGKVRLDMGL